MSSFVAMSPNTGGLLSRTSKKIALFIIHYAYCLKLNDHFQYYHQNFSLRFFWLIVYCRIIIAIRRYTKVINTFFGIIFLCNTIKFKIILEIIDQCFFFYLFEYKIIYHFFYTILPKIGQTNLSYLFIAAHPIFKEREKKIKK